jgi:predicted nucleic acid-binding protein
MTGPPPGVPPRDLVLDASVAIKWYVPEVHSPAALRFMAPDFVMHVPSFFAAECGNTIWKKVAQRGELTADRGRAILDELLTYPRQVHDAESLAPMAFDLALAVGNARLALYDFLYVALAIGLDCRLVTADRVFYDALAPGPYGPYLAWVADPA